MLLERLDRLEEESATLHDFQQRYHDVDKKAGILEERLRERQKRAIAQEILHGAGLVVGSMMVGYAPSLSDVQQLLAVSVGAIMVFGAIVSKATTVWST